MKCSLAKIGILKAVWQGYGKGMLCEIVEPMLMHLVQSRGLKLCCPDLP
jgi:hypothetical protein